MRINTRLSPPFLFSVRARGEPGNEARGCHAQHIYGATALTSGHGLKGDNGSGVDRSQMGADATQ